MKRVLIVALAAMLVASLAPTGVGAKAAAGQEETGTVILPGPGPNGEVTGGCWTGWPRRFWIFSGGATSGPFGSMFEVDESTWEGKFELEVVSGATGDEDLDITFYADPGEIDPEDPAQQAGIVETGSYLSRGPGGESGTVPPTTTLALICLGVGSGFDAEWSYEATPPQKAKKGKKNKKK